MGYGTSSSVGAAGQGAGFASMSQFSSHNDAAGGFKDEYMMRRERNARLLERGKKFMV